MNRGPRKPLPEKPCPQCQANVYSYVEAVDLVDDLVDVQEPGRMPICWSCGTLLVVGIDRVLRLPTIEELTELIRNGTMREIEAVRDALRWVPGRRRERS
jgi:hypothetical protein